MNQALVLAITEFGNCMKLEFVFNENIFEYTSRQLFAQEFIALIEKVISNRDIAVLELLSKK